jgi:hypothetical protein
MSLLIYKLGFGQVHEEFLRGPLQELADGAAAADCKVWMKQYSPAQFPAHYITSVLFQLLSWGYLRQNDIAWCAVGSKWPFI